MIEELTFEAGDITVGVLPAVGARLHRLRAFGHELLRTPDDHATHVRDPFFWGAYPMAPWCNRLAAEPTSVEGRTINLAANFPDGTAIHGQVYDRPWEVAPDRSMWIEGGGDGWPWRYRVDLRVSVDDDHVRMEYGLSNLESAAAMPAGLGIHPWFRRPVDVAIRAERAFPSNLDTIVEPIRVDGPFDTRQRRPLAADLDATWSDIGDPPVELAWVDLGVRAVMRAGAPSLYIVAASPSAVDAVAVEPETHAPDGIRRLLGHEPGAMMLLDPGSTLRLSVDLAFART